MCKIKKQPVKYLDEKKETDVNVQSNNGIRIDVIDLEVEEDLVTNDGSLWTWESPVLTSSYAEDDDVLVEMELGVSGGCPEYQKMGHIENFMDEINDTYGP